MTDYGTDISTFPDLDAGFQLITGPRVVLEALARRLSTPRGSLAGLPDYGIDLRQWLNSDIDERSLQQLKAAIEAEVSKDERVRTASAALTFSRSTTSLRVALAVTLADGPFQLVLSVDRITLSLLQAG